MGDEFMTGASDAPSNPAYDEIKGYLLSDTSPLMHHRSMPGGRARKLSELDKQYIMATLQPWQQAKWHPKDFYLCHRPSRPDDLAVSQARAQHTAPLLCCIAPLTSAMSHPWASLELL